MVRVVIIGATGYTGADSIEILIRHPEAEVTYLTGRSEQGLPVSELFGQFKGRCDLPIEPLEIATLQAKADVALCCLPHKAAMGCVPEILEAGLKVVDFSADYRLQDTAVYEQYYKVEHTDPVNLPQAVYGLPELYRDAIPLARLVANPGCFPTSAMLAAAPLLRAGCVSPSMVVNSVSGVTGGGKTPCAKFHYPNMNEDLFAYGVGTHRHIPEMEQIATDQAGDAVEVLFQPHVGPYDRGILSTVYFTPQREVTAAQVMDLFNEAYAGERFVRVCSEPPHLKHVARTNYCHLYPAVVKGKIVVFAAIDNMVKGASGQAVQNMNLMFGLDEAAGLL